MRRSNERAGKGLEVGQLAVSPEVAADITDLGRTKIYQAISSGDLPSLKFGKRRLIRVAAIEDWLARLEAETSGR